MKGGSELKQLASSTVCFRCGGRGTVDTLRAREMRLCTEFETLEFMISRSEQALCPACAGSGWLLGFAAPV